VCLDDDGSGGTDVEQCSQAVGVFAVGGVDLEDDLCAAAPAGPANGE